MVKAVNIQSMTPSAQALIDRLREQIALRAHQIAAERSYASGRELDNWLAAESQLVWKPELRLEERTDAFIVKFRLPEVRPQDVQLYIDPHSIVLMGEAKSEELVEGAHLHGNEFRYGQIYRQVGLPVPIDPDNAKAHLSDGVLMVSLAKPKLRGERKQSKALTQRKGTKPKKE